MTCRFPVTLPLRPRPFCVWHHPSPRWSVAVCPHEPHERTHTSVLPANPGLRPPPLTFQREGRAPSRTGPAWARRAAPLPAAGRPLGRVRCGRGLGLTFCVPLWCLVQSGCPGSVWGAALSPPSLPRPTPSPFLSLPCGFSHLETPRLTFPCFEVWPGQGRAAATVLLAAAPLPGTAGPLDGTWPCLPPFLEPGDQKDFFFASPPCASVPRV